MKYLLACSLFSATIATTALAGPLDQVATDARSVAAHPADARARIDQIHRLTDEVQVPDTAGTEPIDAALKRAAARLDDDVRIGDLTLIGADARALAGEAERLKQTLGE